MPKAQKFTPDNVMMREKPDGTIPTKYQKLILKDVMGTSKIMQLAKYEEMTDKEKTFEYFAEGPGAYWVGEGQKIKTTKPKWLQVKMVAKKLAVILPVTREYLTYDMATFFTEMQPKIAEAMQIKFDEAGILNVDNPFPQSLDKSAIDANNVVEGDLSYDNLIDLEDKLNDNDFDVQGFISKRQNRSSLREANKIENTVITERLYDRNANTIDGLPVADLKSKNMEKGTIYAGDFDFLRYGIPYGITYKISEDAQLSTLTNEDGTPVNLFEQEMMALRVSMDVGFMVIKDEAFAKIKAVTPPSED